MKKVVLIVGLVVALTLVLAGNALAVGGIDFWFHVEPDCVVQITPYAAYPHRLGGQTFELDVVSVDGVQVARGTFQGQAWYKVQLWCPGDPVTDEGTIFVPNGTSGMAEIWFPLHNVDLGVFPQGFTVMDAE